MPRLFSAFRLPELVEDWLSDLELELSGARWLDPADYHVTIRFFGDVDRHVAGDLVAGLASAQLSGFTAHIKGLGCYGGDRPRALVAEIEAGPALQDLRRAHERIAQSAGLEPERRKYSPHVTLARLHGTHAETIASFIQSVTTPALPSFRVDRVELLSSRPGGGGGPYLLEEAFRLTGANACTGSVRSALD